MNTVLCTKLPITLYINTSILWIGRNCGGRISCSSRAGSEEPRAGVKMDQPMEEQLQAVCWMRNCDPATPRAPPVAGGRAQIPPPRSRLPAQRPPPRPRFPACPPTRRGGGRPGPRPRGWPWGHACYRGGGAPLLQELLHHALWRSRRACKWGRTTGTAAADTGDDAGRNDDGGRAGNPNPILSLNGTGRRGKWALGSRAGNDWKGRARVVREGSFFVVSSKC